MTYDYDYTIIGAGVVGLAAAAEFAPRGLTLLIEKEWKFGQGISSHNSEVVHAGIYYPPGSLKARLCVEGNRIIRELAREHGIGYAPLGKYIVATNEQETAYLTWLKGNAAQNGVTDVRWVEPDELHEQEPDVRAHSALFSPTSGIVDSHSLMSHFKTQAELAGADFAFNSRVEGINKQTSGYTLAILDSNGEKTAITARTVINCAGLYSDEIAAMAGLDVRALGLDLHWAKGYYYTVEGAKFRIRHLVYPVPDPNMKSLGVHATVDIAGGVRFGPTAFYLDRREEDYSFSDENLSAVAEAISRYLPGVAVDGLSAMMSGIRPKLSASGEPARDFYIREESDRGLPGFVNLIGIESPGLTAAPAIAKMIDQLL
ncbi:MAG: NAD(P)/FAD-dependent oxidoreductase [bacterium]|nr:NAD(P)/FAD-dependent oxidoreductase [bacterium]